MWASLRIKPGFQGAHEVEIADDRPWAWAGWQIKVTTTTAAANEEEEREYEED